MLFVGIDQHKRHLTICVRDEQGEIILRRQVSTKWEEVDRFLALLQERGAEHGGYVAVMEVCGFNGWLIKRLEQWGCKRVYVISAPDRVRQKTDRPGSITKAGHPFIRFLLAQMVLHALRGDPGLRRWYRQVKRRRGSKVGRVAVMRRLCESLWHMLSEKEDYRPVDCRGDGDGKKACRPAA